MMEQVIPAKYYRDSGIYELEKEHIFEQEWLFAGMKKDIPNAKDWFTFDLLGHSLVIYNTGKEFKAFQNVCPHRFNRIFPGSKGNGPLMCGYHLWAFNNDGQLMGNKVVAPQPEEKICLKSYLLETVGDFIFVHLSGAPRQSLKEQLTDELHDLLLQFSEQINERIHGFQLPHACNWKFIVENTIERQHCIALHMDTLGKTGFCGTSRPTTEGFWNKNSFFNFISEDPSLEKKRRAFLKHVFDKEQVNNAYKHILLFPNTVISITEGISYIIGRVIPDNARTSVFHISMYATKYRENAYKQLIDEFKEISISFAKAVFDEDKVMLDTVQAGVEQIEHDGYQYRSETRVEQFADSYLKSIN